MSFISNNVNNVVYALDTLTVGSALPGQQPHSGVVNIRAAGGRPINIMGTNFPRPVLSYSSAVLGDWQDLETISTSWNPNIVVPNADETPRIRKDTYADGLVLVYMDGYFEHLQTDPPATPRATFGANDVLFDLPAEWTPPGLLNIMNWGSDRQVQSPGTGRRTSGRVLFYGTDDVNSGKVVKALVGVSVSLAGITYSL
tara:strand:- start:171 stop:767 length:597 start_codon:yes stop_codon:yes gene_type:complete